MDYQNLINDWSAILLCLPCIIFHEYMCGFLLFTEFWCFAMRFNGCYEIWLSHRQNNIFLINDWSSILCIIFHKYADFCCLPNFGVLLRYLAVGYEIWLSHRQNNIFVTKHLLTVNDTTSE